VRAGVSALLLLLAAPAAQAQMYKCVDARGVTQYADKPCADGKGRAVDIRSQPPISGKLAPQGADTRDAESEFQRRRIERSREEEAAADRAEQQKRRCAALHTQLDFFTRVNTVARLNEKGERIYLDDAARAARVDQLKAEIARDCR
jgi:anti-sigma28 factor (negative regulator of flagellin synthesis)